VAPRPSDDPYALVGPLIEKGPLGRLVSWPRIPGA